MSQLLTTATNLGFTPHLAITPCPLLVYIVRSILSQLSVVQLQMVQSNGRNLAIAEIVHYILSVTKKPISMEALKRGTVKYMAKMVQEPLLVQQMSN